MLRFRPLTRKGRLVLVAIYLSMLAFGLAGFFFTEGESAAWWISSAVAFGTFLIGHAIVLWKMDWGYGRR